MFLKSIFYANPLNEQKDLRIEKFTRQDDGRTVQCTMYSVHGTLFRCTTYKVHGIYIIQMYLTERNTVVIEQQRCTLYGRTFVVETDRREKDALYILMIHTGIYV